MNNYNKKCVIDDCKRSVNKKYPDNKYCPKHYYLKTDIKAVRTYDRLDPFIFETHIDYDPYINYNTLPLHLRKNYTDYIIYQKILKSRNLWPPNMTEKSQQITNISSLLKSNINTRGYDTQDWITLYIKKNSFVLNL